MWSLPIRQSVKASGISYERAVNPYQSENDSLIISTDASPSPGLSRVSMVYWSYIQFSNSKVVDCQPHDKERYFDYGSYTRYYDWGCSVLPTYCDTSCDDKRDPCS